MTNIHRDLCWAATILLTVIAKKYGVFDVETADILLLILPIIAILSLRNGRKCSVLGKKGV